MALPTSEQLQALLADLTAVVQDYLTSLDLHSHISRIEVVEQIKKITQSLVAPEKFPYNHGLNVNSSMFEGDTRPRFVSRWRKSFSHILLKLCHQTPEFWGVIWSSRDGLARLISEQLFWAEQ